MTLNSSWDRWTLADQNAAAIVEFTSLISLDVRDEGQVASEPIEEGSFTSYNKTDSPLEVYTTLGVQGEPDALQSVIDRLRELKRSTTTFSLVTPEQEYENLNLESFNYVRRREDGLNALYVELHLVEIREVQSSYSNVALPASKCRNSDNASKVNTGKAQAEQRESVASRIAAKAGFGGG